MELIDINDAVDRVIEELKNPDKVVFHHGTKILATLVYDLIKFGKKGNQE